MGTVGKGMEAVHEPKGAEGTLFSQYGGRFWGALWGIFGILQAVMLTWFALEAWGEWWNWLLLLMTLYPAVLAYYCYWGRKPPEKGMESPDEFGFKVARGLCVGLWALFTLGILLQIFSDSESARFAVVFCAYGLSLQELRVANMMRWKKEQSIAGSVSGLRHREADL